MAGAIVNPRVLNIARPNARLRARQRIIRARMGNITPPPVVARPAPAETPASASAPDGVTAPEPATDEEPSRRADAPIRPPPNPNAEPEPAPDRT